MRLIEVLFNKKMLGIYKILKYVFFAITVIAIIGQVHFNGISRLIIPSILLFFLCSIYDILLNFSKKKYLAFIYIGYIIMLVILLIYSIYSLNNTIVLAIRFFAILLLIPGAFFIKSNKNLVFIFLGVITIHSLYIVGFGIFMMFNTNPGLAVEIREYFRNSGLGDIYTYNGWFYRVQVLGNSLIPFGFFTAVITIKKSVLKNLLLTILLFGIIFSGNFAYYIATIFFLFMYTIFVSYKYYKKILRFKFIIALIIVILSIPTYIYVRETMELKLQSSLPTRVDQYNVLINDMSDSTQSIILGKGLGNTVSVKTKYRDYTGDYYFELQSIYVLNQIGLLPFLLYNLLIGVFLFSIIRNKFIILVYFAYVLYAMTNPYMFDSTNILVIIIIVSAKATIGGWSFDKDNFNMCNNCNLFPYKK